MLLIDAHLDLSLNAVNWNRDLTRPRADIRRSEQRIAGQGRSPELIRAMRAAGILQKLPAILKSRDYSAADIEGIMPGNWLRIFKRALSG